MHGLKFRSHLRSGVSRATKARPIAELIRKTGKYRWVGIYVIENKELAAIAWTGPNAPAHPRFPIHQGLNGKAVHIADRERWRRQQGSSLSDHIGHHPLGNYRPYPKRRSRQVIGTIDVESERLNAFVSRDVRFLEDCAAVLLPLYN
ncbi:MAG: hypothetical protein WBC04_19130 [Candidatus Acidiferrales bacterium]